MLNIKNGYLRDYLKVKKGLHFPSELVFFVSDRCNAKCGHCFWWKNKEMDELSLDEIEKIALLLKRPLSCLRLTGGEPFLRDDLFEICEIFIKRNNTRSININTNGLQKDRIIKTTKKILEVCGSLSIQVSLDGMEETHNKIRGLDGAFEKSLKTIRELKKLTKEHDNLKIAVLTVISNRNHHEIKDLLEYSQRELGIKHHFELIRGTKFLNEEWLIGDYNPLKEDFFPPSPDSLKNTYDQIGEVCKNNSALMSLEFQKKVLEKQKKFVNCVAGNFIGVIYSNGNVALCEMTEPVGNLRENKYSFEKVWHSEEANQRRKQIQSCYCTHGCFFQPSLFYSLKYRLLGYKFSRQL